MMKPTARSSFALSAALVASAALAGCEGKTGPAMKIVVAQGALGGRCNAPPSNATVPASGITTLRLSVLRHTGATRVFVCDRTFAVPKEQPHLRLPTDGVDSFDLIAEGFTEATASDPDNAVHGAFRRRATGILLNVDPNLPNVTELDQLRMLPTEAGSCTDNAMSIGRAFHTATKLPDGTVLVIGGAIASATNPGAEDWKDSPLQLAGTMEIYEPRTGQFRLLTETAAPKPRAFHQAFLLNNAPPYRILLVGGAVIDDATQPALAQNKFYPGPRLIPADGFTALTTKAGGAEIVTFDPAANSVTREAVTGFPPAMFQAGAPFLGGGVVSDGLDYASLPPLPVKQTAALQTGEVSARSNASIVPRYGATLTTMHDGAMLLWGGNYDMTTREPTGEYITGGNGGGTISRLTASLDGEIPTAFHTATALSMGNNGTDVLFTGGFVFNDVGIAFQAIDPNNAVRVVSYSPGSSVLTISDIDYVGFAKDPTCALDNRYRPAGWEAATPIGRDRALIAGGSPSQEAGCQNCPTNQTGFFCALKQMAIYDNLTMSIAKFAELAVARFGHTQTLLDDGTVLVVGGIGSNESGPRVLRDAELVNVRAQLPPIDLTAARKVDLDDPLATELQAAGLERRPGKSATLPNSDKPNKECGLL